MNPYGAVPAALEQTRLSLRDIMANYVGQKIQESKLSLANKQMDMESRALELDAEKQKAKAAFDLARVARETTSRDRLYEQTKAQTNLAQLKYNEQVKMREAQKPLIAKQLGIADIQARTAQEKLALLRKDKIEATTKKPWSYWYTIGGVSPTQQKIHGDTYDTSTPVTFQEATAALKNFNSNIGYHLAGTSAGLVDRLTELKGKLAGQGLPDTERAAVQKEFDTTLALAERVRIEQNYMKKSTTKVTAADVGKLKESAEMVWLGLSDEEKKNYPGGYQAFENTQVQDSIRIIRQGVDQLKEFRNVTAKGTPKGATGDFSSNLTPEKGKNAADGTPWISQKDTQWIVDHINTIEKEQGPEKAEEVKAKVTELLTTGDLKGAKDYIAQIIGPTAMVFDKSLRYAKGEAPKILPALKSMVVASDTNPLVQEARENVKKRWNNHRTPAPMPLGGVLRYKIKK